MFFGRSVDPDMSGPSNVIGAFLRKIFGARTSDGSVKTPIIANEPPPAQIIANHTPTVSVIIPTLNGKKHLMGLFPALKSQKGIDGLEIIIVDSESDDGSAALSREHGARVLQIKRTDFSHSRARNLGSENAAGELLLFMTQDAIPSSPTFAADLARKLQELKVSAISPMERPRSDSDLFGRIAIWHHNRVLGTSGEHRIMTLPENKDYLNLRMNSQLTNVACMVPKNIIAKYGFRGDYAEDLELGLRMINDGLSLAIVRSPAVIHSHNRPAYAHLKRSYLDSYTLFKIFEQYPYCKVQTADLLSEVSSAFELLFSMVYRNGLSYIPIPCKPQLLFDILLAGTAELLGSRSTVAPFSFNMPHFDKAFGSFMQKISIMPMRSRNRSHMGSIFSNIHHHIHVAANEYFRSTFEIIDQHIIEDFKSFIFKVLAFHAGGQLAIQYASGNDEDREVLHDLHEELMR